MAITPPGAGVWRVARNIASLLGADAVDRATSFIVYVAVARWLGALAFGQVVLAVALFQLFSRFSGLGLKDLLTREVARDRTSTGRYFGSAAVLIFGATLLATAALLLLVEILDYSPDTARVIQLLFIGLFPFGIRGTAEAVFIAWERTRYVAMVNIPIHLGQAALAVWLAASGASVGAIAISIVGAYAAMALAHWLVLARAIGLDGMRFEFAFAKSLLKAATPFFGMQGAIALSSSINAIALSKFVGEVGVGVYNAATQLLVPLGLITESTASVLFPIMVRRAKAGVDELRRVTEQATELIMSIIFPAVVLIAGVGATLLELVYGSGGEYTESVRVLRIIVWMSLAHSVTAVFARVLLTAGGEKQLLKLLGIRAVVQLVGSVLLVWQFGVLGAAFATVIVGSVNVGLHTSYVLQVLSRFKFLAVAWRPAAASLVMGIYLFVYDGQNFVARILIGSAIYLAVLAGLIGVSPGGFRRLWSND